MLVVLRDHIYICTHRVLVVLRGSVQRILPVLQVFRGSTGVSGFDTEDGIACAQGSVLLTLPVLAIFTPPLLPSILSVIGVRNVIDARGIIGA